LGAFASRELHAIGRYAFRGVELHSDRGSLVYLNAPLGSFGSVALAALTKRQIEVAALIALGLRSNEVVEELNISVHTLKQHLAAVYRLLGVSRREQLVAILHARGFEAS
jgi:DNA-binding CsgD family transcriptional regulator